MTNPALYVLDSSVFIEAARRYYGLDFAPGFWDALESHGRSGHLVSIDRVKSELERGNDDLAEWAQTMFGVCFARTNEKDIIEAYADVMKWVGVQTQFFSYAKADFARGADGWLAAFARARNCTLVTQEEYSQNIKRQVPIPNVCRSFGITCINTFDMMRALGIKLRT